MVGLGPILGISLGQMWLELEHQAEARRRLVSAYRIHQRFEVPFADHSIVLQVAAYPEVWQGSASYQETDAGTALVYLAEERWDLAGRIAGRMSAASLGSQTAVSDCTHRIVL